MADGSGVEPETGVNEQPHNIEAEQALLGALLVNNDVYDRVSGIVNDSHFFDPVHGRIFEVAARRIQKNALASPVTLKAFLEDDPGLAELGGAPYLARLAGAATSLIAARDYAQMIYDLSIRRDLIRIGEDISFNASHVDVESDPAELIVEAEQNLYSLGEKGRVDKGFQSFLSAVTDAVNVANAAYKRDGGLAGVSTGLTDLDAKLGGLHPSDLLILAGRRTHGLDVIMVDYLQLLRPASSRSDGRVQEISEITQGLKAIAKELAIPVVALSQLSRQVESREDKRPQLSDLRESGSIEQDADVVMFVFREEYYKEREKPGEHDTEGMMKWQDEMQALEGKAEVVIGKQRHGPIGTVDLAFEGRFTRFSDLVKPWQQGAGDFN